MRITISLSIVFGVLLSAAIAPAQTGSCTPFPNSEDDGFDSGCCSTPTPNLPQLAPIQTAAKWGWISECTPTSFDATVSIDVPQFVACDYAVAHVNATMTVGSQITFVGGNPPMPVYQPVTLSLSGTLLMKYARTWGDTDQHQLQLHQVWRFLVNGDLHVTTNLLLAAQQPGPIPYCSLFHNLPLHVVGHIDYACEYLGSAGGGPLRAAFSLSHLPECLSHAPYARHPIPALAGFADSYHLVGPAPFTFSPVPEPQGPTIGETVRGAYLDLLSSTYQCQGDANVHRGVGQLQTQSQSCLCSGTPPQAVTLWKHQALDGQVCCYGQMPLFSNLPILGNTFPTGFAALPLGEWSAGSNFPGNRRLTIYVGLLDYIHPCPTGSFQIPGLEGLQAVTGVATSGHGYFGASPFHWDQCATMNVLATNAIDLQNMLYLHPAIGGGLLPTIGGFFFSNLVWNLNVQ